MRNSRLGSLALAISILGFSLSQASPAAAAGTVPAAFTITGSGWGHGLGMSQYGAYGMAMDYLANPGKITVGCSIATEASTNSCIADDIIRHYYSGTTIGYFPQAGTLYPNDVNDFKVGLLQDVTNFQIKGSGASLILSSENGSKVVTSEKIVTFTASGLAKASWDGGSITGKNIKITWNNPTNNSPLGGLLAIKKPGATEFTKYKYGYVNVIYGAYGIRDIVADLLVVNTLKLNTEYLYGIGEMPSSWSPAALQAQVIASRSYALYRYYKSDGSVKPLSANCQCNVYDSIYNQVFVGYSKEAPPTSGGTDYGKLWVAAVNATGDGTKYKIAKYGNSVIDAYFASSTGGSTSPISEVWGSSGYPYLAQENDTWAVAPEVNNQFASWSVTISQATLVSKLNSFLGEQGAITDIYAMSIVKKKASGAISEFDIVDSGGNVKRIYVRPTNQWTTGRLDISPDQIRTLIGAAEIKPKSRTTGAMITSFNGSNYIASITPGDATTAGSTSTQTAKLSSASMAKIAGKAAVESQITFSGTTKPTQAAIKVELQQKTASNWKTLLTSQTNSSGRWTFTWGSATAGKKTIRVKVTNSRNSVSTPSTTITFSSAVSISGITKAARSTQISLNGSTSPARIGLTVIVERKVGTAAWKRVGTVKTDEYGGWAFTSSTTNKKVITQFRARLTDKTVGSATSKVIKVKVK